MKVSGYSMKSKIPFIHSLQVPRLTFLKGLLVTPTTWNL